MIINKENLPLYIGALRNKPFAAKVLCSDGPFSKPGIQSYYTVFQRGENDDTGLIIRGEDIGENSFELKRDGCQRRPNYCWGAQKATVL